MGDIFAIQSLKTCSELHIKPIFSISRNVKIWQVRFSRSWSEMQSSPPAESIETILIVNWPAQFWSATSVFRDRTLGIGFYCNSFGKPIIYLKNAPVHERVFVCFKRNFHQIQGKSPCRRGTGCAIIVRWLHGLEHNFGVVDGQWMCTI